MRTAEHFHQCALARAILANQRVHYTRRHLERHPAQGARRPKTFPDAIEPKRGRRVRHHFRYLSNGGFTTSAISGELKLAFVTKPTPVSITGSTFLPCSTATIVFTPR